jgi:ketosteroid isomerase-like protein
VHQGYQAARTIQRTYQAVHQGASRATTGSARADAVLHATSRAHHHLQAKVDEGARQASEVPNVYTVTRRGGAASTGNTRLDKIVNRAGRAHNTVERAGVSTVASTVLNHPRPTSRRAVPAQQPEQVWRRVATPQSSTQQNRVQRTVRPKASVAPAASPSRAATNPVVVELARARTGKAGADG